MSGSLYLIENQDTERYLGSTNDLERRLKEHNRGQTTYTRGRGSWRCIKIWECKNVEEARQIEFFIKRMKRKLSEENIEAFIGYFREGKKGLVA